MYVVYTYPIFVKLENVSSALFFFGIYFLYVWAHEPKSSNTIQKLERKNDMIFSSLLHIISMQHVLNPNPIHSWNKRKKKVKLNEWMKYIFLFCLLVCVFAGMHVSKCIPFVIWTSKKKCALMSHCFNTSKLEWISVFFYTRKTLPTIILWSKMCVWQITWNENEKKQTEYG